MGTSSVPAGTSRSAAGAGCGAATTAGADTAGGGAAGGFPPSLAGAGSSLVRATGSGFSPSPAITAIGVLTLTPSVPSGTRICDSLPSSTASTSMVALSVSISAMTSPEWTSSPTFLSHLASLPSSIVGDSAGIRISGMSPPSRRHIHIGPELGHIRLGIGQGKIGCIGHALADLGVDALQLLLVGKPFLQQACLDLLDRVMLL